MNTLEAIKFGSNLLKEKKIPSYILDSELLLSKTLNKSREIILTNLDMDIEKILIEWLNNIDEGKKDLDTNFIIEELIKKIK